MLSQTCEYALRAVACLARQPGEFVTASALADATTVPSDYLSKVLQQLASANVVQGRRGVGGGYRLARDPKDINLHDIIDAMGVITRMRACPNAEQRDTPCPLHDTMDRAIQAAEQVFRDTTLADLVAQDAKSAMCIKRWGDSPATPGAPGAPATPGVSASHTAGANGYAPKTSTQVDRPVSSARLGSNGNLRDERFARAATAATPTRSADDEFDAARPGNPDTPVYTANGKLRAKPRIAPGVNARAQR